MRKIPIMANSYDPVVRFSPYIDINSYHSGSCSELSADLRKEPLSKPIVISDDGTHLAGCTGPSHCPAGTPGKGLDAACTGVFAASAKAKGQHYEHLALTIDGRVESCNTQKVGWGSMTAYERGALKKTYQYATPLAPRGEVTVSSGKILWNGAPVTLIGYSFYGSLVSKQVELTPWFDALDMRKRTPLGARKGANMTRTWCLDQWASTKTACSGGPHLSAGMTPFAESGVGLPNRYDLTQPNEAFYARLRAYLQQAWDRGIVVILTLFERNGLKKRPTTHYGSFDGSPYNYANNKHDSLLQKSAGSDYPLGFLSSGCGGEPTVAEWHKAFIARVVREVRPYGNVILEIMNEAAPQASPDPAWDSKVGEWQVQVASYIRQVEALADTAPLPAWECVPTETPIPPPDPVPGESVVRYFEGFTSTPYNHNKEFQIRFPEGATRSFRKFKVDYDVTPSNFESGANNTHHCLGWLNADKPWNRMLIYLNALKAPNSTTVSNQTRLDSNYPSDLSGVNFPGGVRTGVGHHVSMLYDGEAGRVSFKITSNVTGETVSSGGINQVKGVVTDDFFKLQLGTQAGEGPEAATYGWVWSGIKVECIP